MLLPQETSPAFVVKPLSTLSPPSNSRTWQSAPHPTLPLVATACSDRSVRVYSLTSFTLLHTITGGHKRSVRSVSWKPGTQGQSVLATGSFDASAGIWRREDQGLEENFTSPRRVESGEEEEEDDDEYQFSCILDGHESEIKSLSWSPSGQFLATCSRDKSVWIWEEIEDDNFETVAVLQEHEGDVKCVAWHPEEDLLASASYDDTVRLYREDADDWVQVAMLDAHKQTVWWVEFEGSGMIRLLRGDGKSLTKEQEQYLEWRERSGPRLATASDDCTIRIWHRIPREHSTHNSSNNGIPSIIRSATLDEDWVQETILPQRHERAVYSVSWSRRSGLIASAGSDGKIIVYQERWKSQTPNGVADDPTPNPDGTNGEGDSAMTEWVIIAELYSAHDVFEINHVCWARRADKGRRSDDEEVILSTGDDGEVRVWTLEEQVE
ncbi:cytosolic iron-sulfur protein assembly protein 1 [Delitschia confertaspora ATCC 74209]|uniref:Probable cytosolic iron-sulfur protein assembly protein 1 n=1 Tax=Delitschia confertaspora ATCC 74209 TaxID=1513339 RepID=A0A9P4MWB4_9PLEO|nr:cytosolic iron-sulfur protein assembly protein 1 [Delitschia confertaspora ATCC 74209]